jgi:proteasome lid subunit RPN8/RPN11
MIRIPLDVWGQAARHCVETAPEEAVGYLAARRDAEDDITDAIAVLNVADDARNRYEVDEREQLDVWDQLDAQHKRPVVTYHSHIGAPAVMSPVDIDMARDPRMLHLIVSLHPAARPSAVAEVALFRVEYHEGLPEVVGLPFAVGDQEFQAKQRANPQVRGPGKES